jgi:nitrogen regulatory protein P-II 1
MKGIKAYIKAHKLQDVIHALHGVEGLTGVSVVHCHGFGVTRRKHTLEDDLELLDAHVKIEVMCNNELVETVVAVILKHAHTGLTGDGSIFVSNIEDAIRIATGERGEEAV